VNLTYDIYKSETIEAGSASIFCPKLHQKFVLLLHAQSYSLFSSIITPVTGNGPTRHCSNPKRPRPAFLFAIVPNSEPDRRPFAAARLPPLFATEPEWVSTVEAAEDRARILLRCRRRSRGISSAPAPTLSLRVLHHISAAIRNNRSHTSTFP
jgi:hypothetical protein